MRAHWFLLLVACGSSGSSGEPDPTPPPPAPADAAPAPTAPAPAPVTPPHAAAASAVPCFEVVPQPLDEVDTDKLTLVPVRFSDLPGWADDRQAEALPALLASCEVLGRMADATLIGVDGYSGRARDWRPLCTAVRALKPGDHAGVRRLLEREMLAYAALGRAGADGKMTGYNVTSLDGSHTRHGRYQTPIWGRPPELVSVDLTRFIADARARKLWGRVDGGTVLPMPTRAEIRTGALSGRGLELLWVDDPIDALFANIEGSGRVHMDDGSTVRIEFAGKNGR
ncbi:MAG TPA: MltA domain-containing protein, partial [Kofleriaceae bacterium]|nr:MltA domain-containing protein [Kofleriaceae bacterium]